jgi:hypothetical protein
MIFWFLCLYLNRIGSQNFIKKDSAVVFQFFNITILVFIAGNACLMNSVIIITAKRVTTTSDQLLTVAFEHVEAGLASGQL